MLAGVENYACRVAEKKASATKAVASSERIAIVDVVMVRVETERYRVTVDSCD